VADAQRQLVTGLDGQVGRLAHDVHPLPTLYRLGRVGPGTGHRASVKTPCTSCWWIQPPCDRHSTQAGCASYWAQPRCLTNKLNVVADALGCLVRVGLLADQCLDAPQALPLLQNLASAFIVADRGYDSDPLVAVLGAYVTQTVVLPPHMPCTPRRYDVASCAQSYQVEQLFSCPKQMRWVVTHYDKRHAHFLAFIRLAATVLWLPYLAIRWVRIRFFLCS
jgi:transposase